MKNAKLKLTEEAAAARGWKLIERDRMPEEVASGYLCALVRISNRERKQFTDARVRSFSATAEKKPAEMKLSSRAAGATLGQLGKWTRRLFKRRRGLQRKYELAIRLPKETHKEQLVKGHLVAGLDLRAGAIDLAIDSFCEEIKRREGL